MTLSEVTDGIDLASASYKDAMYKVKSDCGASMELARILIKNGCEDQSYEVRSVDGGLRFYGSSLYRLANLTIRDDDTMFGFVKYHDHDVTRDAP